VSRAKVRYSDVISERLYNGGWLLAVMHDGRRIVSRFFEYKLRDAKQRFIADIQAGLL
jgi:hypothetical protein